MDITPPELHILDLFEDKEYERRTVDVFIKVCIILFSAFWSLIYATRTLISYGTCTLISIEIRPILLMGFITTLAATLAAWPVTQDSRLFRFMMFAVYRVLEFCRIVLIRCKFKFMFGKTRWTQTCMASGILR